ncbi:hypothetical protein PGH47_43065 (plasmid) [Streptomyces sp. HUAS 31]|uniref:hypothetical protein n=1 Tax=Streptomyces sp. HUAS 31 TaxID=3020055 RepID=UPI0023051EC4|nr:hypothetical protein [Streptomyces sp. HUAS 31]WCE02527.1 hypothetical protein PGH47_43065 [Streptomyces sp. HUAS 31]
MNDKSEASAKDASTRLNLPVLGSIERRWDTYGPFLKRVRVYRYKENPQDKEFKEGFVVEEPPPKSTFGSDVNDPPAVGSLDDRGWSCEPGEPCTWFGPI